MDPLVTYIARVSIQISILFNVVTGGSTNQTFSARNYEWKRKNLPNLVSIIDAIFFWQPNHCMICWTYWVTLNSNYDKMKNLV